MDEFSKGFIRKSVIHITLQRRGVSKCEEVAWERLNTKYSNKLHMINWICNDEDMPCWNNPLS